MNEDTNAACLDELSASSVHTSDLSDFEEYNSEVSRKSEKRKESSKRDSRSTTRRKRSLNPKYYSHEFTQDYRNVSKSRSSSSSSSSGSKNKRDESTTSIFN